MKIIKIKKWIYFFSLLTSSIGNSMTINHKTIKDKKGTYQIVTLQGSVDGEYELKDKIQSLQPDVPSSIYVMNYTGGYYFNPNQYNADNFNYDLSDKIGEIAIYSQSPVYVYFVECYSACQELMTGLSRKSRSHPNLVKVYHNPDAVFGFHGPNLNGRVDADLSYLLKRNMIHDGVNQKWLDDHQAIFDTSQITEKKAKMLVQENFGLITESQLVNFATFSKIFQDSL